MISFRHPTSGHLIFGYCYPCAVAGDHTKDCEHTWDERGWVGTFTTVELEAAVKEKWAVTDVREVGDVT